MGYLANTRFYLSGPIEFGTENWRTEPKKVLNEEFGINIFDPFEDQKQQWLPSVHKARIENNYEEMARIAKQFVRKDLCLVDRSDALIAYLPYKVPTTGTHHEIINSVNAKKPTLLICPQGKSLIPIWYYGFIPHEAMFGSWEEAYTYLRDVENGKYKNNNRWSYVYGLV